jgi:putative glutamine amidotransferase
MSALIGLSSCMNHPDPERALFKGKRLLYMEESMFHWVQRCGGTAVMIPSMLRPEDMRKVVSRLDGILLSGGADIAPESYGEKPLQPEWSGDRIRDKYELALFAEAMLQKKPILGVCRGHQLVNVALGGTLFQDIQTQNEGALLHRDWEVYDQNFHEAVFEPESTLANLYAGKAGGMINSVHHQAIKVLGKGLAIEARSMEDRIIEAVYLTDGTNYVRGIQWHPEFQDIHDESLLNPDVIMEDFLQAIAGRK